MTSLGIALSAIAIVFAATPIPECWISKPPVVSTGEATNINTNQATLNGNLDELGSASSVKVFFQWGESEIYGNEITMEQMDKTGAFYFSLTGLSPKTTYYFRAKAVGDGENYGSGETFTTPRSEIEITFPLDGALVAQEITVKGYATAELCEEQHLYIMVEYGGRWWPQYSEIVPGYSASSKKWEFSTPADIGLPEDVEKSFTIRAILVDDAIHQHFQNWFQQATWIGIPITDVNQWGKMESGDGVTVTRR